MVLTLPHPVFTAEYGAGLDLFSPTLQGGSPQSKGDLGEQPPPVMQHVPGIPWGLVMSPAVEYHSWTEPGSGGPLPSDLALLVPSTSPNCYKILARLLFPLVLEKWAKIDHLGQGGGHCRALSTTLQGAFIPFPHHGAGGMKSQDLCPLARVVIISLIVTMMYSGPWSARILSAAFLGICNVNSGVKFC